MDARNIDKIAERYDLVWQRQPNRMLRARRFVTWICAAIGLIVVGIPFLINDHRAYESRCVSEAHRLFEVSCRDCHDRQWQPLLRLVTANDRARSVSDQACQKCHAEQTRDHHASVLTPEEPRDCVQCHQEHRGRSLLELADATCTQCHADLAAHSLASHEPRVASSVTGWHDHPEFALQRPPADLAAIDHLATFVAQAESTGWRDRSAIRFNHRLHLAPEGLPVPPGHAEFGDGRTWKKLVCADCHETAPDGTGNFMRPVNYEQHCQACHRLDFSARLTEARDLPHGDADLVRGVLRQRLSEYLAAHPEALDGAVDRSALPQSPVDPPAQPNEAERADPADEERDAARRWQWIESQLAEVSNFVAQRSDLAAATSKSGLVKRVATGCQYCHDLQNADQPAAWQVVPPGIPQRWLPHGEFRHASHSMVRCADCHDANSDSQSVAKSSDTADILLPGIASCRKCHVTSGQPARAGSAGTRCVDCHRYHQREHATLRHSIRNSLPIAE